MTPRRVVIKVYRDLLVIRVLRVLNPQVRQVHRESFKQPLQEARRVQEELKVTRGQ
jgi:hypothetical protein